jgi:hypothetical protein
VVAAGVTAVIIAAVATAAIPSSDGTINACYDKETGALRVIDEGQICTLDLPENPGEQHISWNQQGPPGPAGPAGEAGGPGKLPGQQETNSVGSQELEGLIKPSVGSQTKKVNFKFDANEPKPIYADFKGSPISVAGNGVPPPLLSVALPKGNWDLSFTLDVYDPEGPRSWAVDCVMLPGKGDNSASVSHNAYSPNHPELILRQTLEAKEKVKVAVWCYTSTEGLVASQYSGFVADPLPPKATPGPLGGTSRGR